ncbi:DUF2264 domain-containing protein [Roseomonas gilardii]|uniref:DUF2264 domain-containing protein n=1 Tax=Roseomonas gilardii TaxID=257708 RepID=UPI0011A63C50|nr:DUF2264 domain-containing protein [Roseomonas gilardii]
MHENPHAAIRGNPLASRADAARLLLDLNAPLRPCFSPGRAQVRLGLDSAHFDRKAEWFEGYARPLWGLAPLAAGGGDFDGWSLFREGLASGGDPTHPEYWEAVTDHDQRSVEMAALGFALALVPEHLWDPLPEPAKRNLATWLGGVQRVVMADNNWHFFPVMAGLGLQRVGLPIDEASRDRHLVRIEEFYLRDGWYGDGAGGHIDHYNGFALQFYGLAYAALAGGRDPERAARYRDRAAAFARGFRHWFGDDGATLAIGRSLTYRFATAAFWGALAYAGVEALPWGVIRGLWARQIRWWLQQPMLDEAGRMRVGYRWPNLLMSENYNSQGSPYWAFKAFLPLALPETHPFWQAEEAPHPDADGVTLIPGASMLVQRQGGDVTALPAGPSHDNMRGGTEKYAKFAYSTHLGPCMEAARWIHNGACGDNILAVSTDERDWHIRRDIPARRLGPDWIETGWSPLAGVEVTTLQFFSEGWEIRLHDVRSDHPVATLESGHAVPCRVRSRKRPGGSVLDLLSEGGLLLRAGDAAGSAILDPLGRRRSGAMDVMANTSLMFPQAAVPVLGGRLPPGRHLLATAVRAERRAGTAFPLPGRDRIAARAAEAGWDAAWRAEAGPPPGPSLILQTDSRVPDQILSM